ncbi:MAG TPA: tripartite tricarboxylate transporter TctB family protein, partial [Thermaerobacter sp.]
VATGLGLMAATLRPRAMRRRTGGRGGAGLAEPGVPAQAGPGPSRGALAAGSQSVPVDPAPAQADPGPPREGAGPAGKEADDSPRQGRIPLLVTAAATTAYLVALPRLGFPLASGLFMAGLSWYLGERRLSVAILWGGLFAAALWAGFVRGLGVPLPVGPLGRP